MTGEVGGGEGEANLGTLYILHNFSVNLKVLLQKVVY